MKTSGKGLKFFHLKKETSPGNALYLVLHNDHEQKDKCCGKSSRNSLFSTYSLLWLLDHLHLGDLCDLLVISSPNG